MEETAAEFVHEPVMLAEVVEHLQPCPGGLFVDATVGGGGHARAVLAARPELRLLGIDRDPEAIRAARINLAGYEATFCQVSFDTLGSVLDSQGDPHVAAALFDLGLSSPQVDNPERGFSYRLDGPLDMRMDPAAALCAADIVNTWSEPSIAHLLRTNSDERFARRIAKAVVAGRPVQSTAQLAELVREAIPAAARRRGGHPAKRTFQAIRIAVNEELAQLEPALEAVVDRMIPDARGVVLSYHSGEDRIVKRCLRRLAALDHPAGLPRPTSAPAARVDLLPRRSRRPDSTEIATNPRAASARFRGFRKLAEHA